MILIQLLYLIASVLFIIGIKMMNKTKEARAGNLVSSVGMLIAIIATLLQINIVSFAEIIVCMALGSAIGLYYANKVKMTKIPEMVSLFNGFGGMASMAVAISDFWLKTNELRVRYHQKRSYRIIIRIFPEAIKSVRCNAFILTLSSKSMKNRLPVVE